MGGASYSNYGPAILLLAIQLAGLYCMFGVAYQNGYIQSLINVFSSDVPLLPGSQNPVLLVFKLPPLDHLLSLAQVMYANFLDGSSPASSLYALQFGGQLVCLSAIIWIESTRVGNQKTMLFIAVPWILLCLAIGFGAVIGFYTILHLLFSPTATIPDSRALAARAHISDSTFGRVLPLSIIFGQVIPTALMALPLFSVVVHQWLNALWQAYPIWSLLVMAILGYHFRQGSPGITPETPSKSHSASRLALHQSYSFAFNASALVQILTYTVLGAGNLVPGLGLQEITLADVFKPEAPWYPVPPMRNAATGALTLFQYDQYFGATATIVWAVTLLYNAQGRSFSASQWASLVVGIICWSVCVGPLAVAVMILWQRDDSTFQWDAKGNDDQSYHEADQRFSSPMDRLRKVCL